MKGKRLSQKVAINSSAAEKLDFSSIEKILRCARDDKSGLRGQPQIISDYAYRSLVRSTGRWCSQVADGTFTDRAGITLQSDGLQVIFGLAAGQNCVGAVVTGFAIQPTMTGGLFEELAGVLGMFCIVAIGTARLIHPGRAILIGQHQHAAYMAIGAGHA